MAEIHVMPELDLDGGLQVMTLDEAKAKRKSKGLCPTCGEVRTHKPGIWKAMMPETVDGLVYKGICLKCNSLASVQMELGEPISSAAMEDSRRGSIHQHHRIASEPPIGINKPPTLEGFRQSSMPAEEMNESAPKRSVSLRVPGSKREKAINSLRGSINMFSKSKAKVVTRHSTATDEDGELISEGSASGTTSHPSNNASPAEKKAEVSATHLPPVRRPNIQRSSLQRSMPTATASGPPVTPLKKETSMPPVKTTNTHRSVLQRSMPASTASEKGKGNSGSSPTSTELMHAVKKANAEAPKISGEMEKMTVKDFRCSDSNGDSGFYTGTVTLLYNVGNLDGAYAQESIPHGRGELTYDSDGRIAKGVWSKGELKVKVSDKERYEPYLLPSYSVGDEGHDEDMVRKASTEAISKLHVGDGAFIRRSGGKWSYALVKSWEDGNDPAIIFQVNEKGSTKTIAIAESRSNVRPPRKPDVLPGYEVGAIGRDEDMIIESKQEATKLASTLRIGDGAFVKRSDGSWAYALVVDRFGEDELSLKFVVNARGSTKVVEVLKSAKFVRRIKHSDGGGGAGLSDEKADAIFKLMRAAERGQ